ncbi:MAG: hypothetical protein DMG90_21620, partial [Acidobacteria bacterium]
MLTKTSLSEPQDRRSFNSKTDNGAGKERIYRTRRMRFFCTVSFLMYAAIAGRAQDLSAGYAKADITPAEPVMMGGYDLRGAPSDGIHGNDRLYARALVFEASGVRLAFVE